MRSKTSGPSIGFSAASMGAASASNSSIPRVRTPFPSTSALRFDFLLFFFPALSSPSQEKRRTTDPQAATPRATRRRPHQGKVPPAYVGSPSAAPPVALSVAFRSRTTSSGVVDAPGPTSSAVGAPVVRPVVACTAGTVVARPGSGGKKVGRAPAAGTVGRAPRAGTPGSVPVTRCSLHDSATPPASPGSQLCGPEMVVALPTKPVTSSRSQHAPEPICSKVRLQE
mmetsp:Transcript_5291/g.15666  ORF Transcript_5291/g.15666 Transcript_5291/m.15666 type:complete len:226 (+) Transcript_5291:531-1208(+)